MSAIPYIRLKCVCYPLKPLGKLGARRSHVDAGKTVALDPKAQSVVKRDISPVDQEILQRLRIKSIASEIYPEYIRSFGMVHLRLRHAFTHKLLSEVPVAFEVHHKLSSHSAHLPYAVSIAINPNMLSEFR